MAALSGALLLAVMAGVLMHLLVVLEVPTYVLLRAAVIIIGAGVAGYYWWRKEGCRRIPDLDQDVRDPHDPRHILHRTIVEVCPDDDDYERVTRKWDGRTGP